MWDIIVVCSNYFIATYIQKQTICKLKKKRKPISKDNKITILLYSTFVEFLLFLIMPIFIEMVMSIRTCITVYLMVSLVFNILERMKARVAFLCSKP